MADAEKPKRFSHELCGAVFAGNVGLSPRVLFGSAENGLLLTEPSNNLYVGEKEGAQEPRLGLSWALLNALRELSISPHHGRRFVDGQQAVKAFDAKLAELSDEQKADD